MSQHDDTLTQQLKQRLEEIKASGEEQDWLRDIVQWLVQELLDLEFTDFLGVEPYERSNDRHGYRNGYRQRGLVTRVGRLWLRVPRDREGRFPGQDLRLHGDLRTLPAKRKGTRPGPSGDLSARGIDPKSAANHRKTVRR